MESINRVGNGDVKKYLERAASRVASADYLHFKHSLEPLGLELAEAVHAKIFTAGLERTVEEIARCTGFDRSLGIAGLARIISHLHGNEMKVTEVATVAEDRLELTIKTCPFCHYVRQGFGEPFGSPYFRSLWKAEATRIKRIADVVGLGSNLAIEQSSFMCNGDNQCRIDIAKC